MIPERADVVIVGAGTAGAAAALQCAQRGLSVVCLERGALGGAGARWVNGVAASAFAAAGIAEPCGDERRGGGGAFHLVAGYGPQRVTIRDHGVLEVDMRLLVSRLQAAALEAGATLLADVDVRGVDGENVRTSAGRVRADWIVDASGLAGARLLEQPRVDVRHICAAAQHVREVVDHAGARAFCEQHRAGLDEVVCFAGVAGGYSIINVRYDGETVSILTGSIPGAGYPSGAAMLRDFAAQHPWIGPRIFGGERAIPVRRPFDRIAAGRVAAIGDAACQVFSAHGSGIGPGMVAARALADALAAGRGVDGYAVEWQRAYGGLLASFDLFRRLSQTLALDQLEYLIEQGVMDAELVRGGMAQEYPRPRLAAAPNQLRALAGEPRLAARFADMAARMIAVRGLYARYPRRASGLRVWSRLVAGVFGEAADQL